MMNDRLRFDRRSNSQFSILNSQFGRSAAGFTLLELVIALGITIVLFAVGIPSFRTYQHHLQLENAAADLKALILEARTLALAPEATKPPLVVGYGVATSGATDWRLVRFVMADGGQAIERELKSLTLPVAIERMGGDEPVVFLLSDQGKPASTSRLVIDLRSTTTGTERSVQILAQSGQVSIE